MENEKFMFSVILKENLHEITIETSETQLTFSQLFTYIRDAIRVADNVNISFETHSFHVYNFITHEYFDLMSINLIVPQGTLIKIIEIPPKETSDDSSEGEPER